MRKFFRMLFWIGILGSAGFLIALALPPVSDVDQQILAWAVMGNIAALIGLRGLIETRRVQHVLPKTPEQLVGLFAKLLKAQQAPSTVAIVYQLDSIAAIEGELRAAYPQLEACLDLVGRARGKLRTNGSPSGPNKEAALSFLQQAINELNFVLARLS